MELKETQVKWGNGYVRYYFLNGKRISESHANRILDIHMSEQIESGRHGSCGWYTLFNIGPKLDAPTLLDHPDMR